MTSPSARLVPRWLLVWLSALAGLSVPLLATGLIIWPLVGLWIVIVGVLALADRWIDPGPLARIWFTVATIVVLVLFGEEGGFFLIPAALISLAIDVRDRAADRGGRDRTDHPAP